MQLHDDEAAGITDSPLLMVVTLVVAGLMIVAVTSDPVATGTDIGDRAPELTSMAYDGAGWANFAAPQAENEHLNRHWLAPTNYYLNDYYDYYD